MRSHTLLVTAVLAATMVTVSTDTHAGPCWMCTAYGCENSAVGFLTCWAGSIGGTPVCAVAGACPQDLAGGDDDHISSKRRSPNSREAAPTTGSEGLGLFWLTIPVDAGMSTRLGGAGIATLRAVADPGRPETFVRAVARHMGTPPGRLRVANAEALTGPHTLVASFVAPDGGGYTIEAEGTGRGARVGLCRIEARSAVERLTREILEPGDLLVVPTRLEGESCLMALAVAPPFGMGDSERVAEARLRRSFHEAGRHMTRAGAHRGFRMELLAEPAACR